jgi:hypothetical protein
VSENSQAKRCKAHKKTGEACGNWALRGADVCRYHGGKAPQVKAAIARNLMQGELRSLLQKHGRDIPITDPLTALQEHAGKVRAWMDFLEDRIGALRHSSQWDTEQVRGEVQLFTDAQSQVRQTLVDMGKLKIDERLIAIEEGKVAMLWEALKAGLAAGGVTGPGPTQAAFAAAAGKLRVIAGGKADDQGQIRKAAGY